MLESQLHELQQAANLLRQKGEGRNNPLPFSEKAIRPKEAYSRLQERLSCVNLQLHAAVKLCQDSILFLDLEGVISLVNPAAQKWLFQEYTQVLGSKFWDLLPDEYFGFSMRECLKFGISHRRFFKNLNHLEVEISSVFLSEGPRTCHGLLLILRDCSEKKRLLAAALHSDRLKQLGEATASIVHEIRNPLGSIRGFASLLKRDLEPYPPLQEMALTILDGIKILEKLTTVVLQFAKPLLIHPESADLAAFLKKVVRFVKADPAFPQEVRIAMNIPNGSFLIPFDPAALQSALLNLIFNAVQAMPNGGELSLSLIQMERSCQISVTDTGIGMNPDTMQHLFSPFFTTKKWGNGLGLIEVQKIVQAHYGTIDVRSSLGKGSTFTISLPSKR